MTNWGDPPFWRVFAVLKTVSNNFIAEVALATCQIIIAWQLLSTWRYIPWTLIHYTLRETTECHAVQWEESFFCECVSLPGLVGQKAEKEKKKGTQKLNAADLNPSPKEPVTPTEWRIFWWQSCRFLATPCWLGGLANISDAVHTTSKLDDIQSPPRRKDPLCKYTIITSSLLSQTCNNLEGGKKDKERLYTYLSQRKRDQTIGR